MTLTIAWTRDLHGAEAEMVVATDSRLTGGYTWDAAPKILPLPRNDSVLAFAGDTNRAYPLMLQAANAVATYRRSMNRSQTLEVMKKHLVKVFNRMEEERRDLADPAAQPEALFILGGFSWASQRFRIWIVFHNRHIGTMSARTAPEWSKGRRQIAILGHPDDVVAAKALLREKLRVAGRLTAASFDWEPLQVIADMSRSADFGAIGGPPQVVKVYRSLVVVPFIVPWKGPNGVEVQTLLGRPLLSYETPSQIPVLPEDALK